MLKIKASDYISKFLEIQGITHVFEVAGGMITHIIDSLFKAGVINIISVHHEQAAAFAAEAYGRCTGRPGVAMATSGPGATNLLTGIASCFFDSTPALFITGQVNTHEQKGTRNIRQLGFQETDIISMAKPITKACFSVEEAQQLPEILNQAFKLALCGRPGPVLIDIPMNLQNTIIEADDISYINQTSNIAPIDDEALDQLLQAIKSAKKPLILAGQGIRCAQALNEFQKFLELSKLPVVTSLLGLDAIPFNHEQRVGFIGSYGNRWANLAIGHSDLLICIGSRLDIRQTGADIEGFKKNKIIFHIDCDENEINNRVKDCIPIISDIKSFLNAAVARYSSEKLLAPQGWIQDIKKLQQEWPDTAEQKEAPGINPNYFMHQLSALTQEHLAYLADVGSHQMWAAQSLEIGNKQRFITSGGMGAMGFALPAAIGFSLASGKSPVVAIVGDGAIQMNIQELQTVVRNQLPIKIIVMNNKTLGMIRQFQDSYFEGRYQSTYWGYSAPDFVAIAQAYQIPAFKISCTENVNAGLQWLEKITGPALLEVMIHPHVNVYPKIAFGRPITEMEPFALPVAMEAT